METRAKCGDKCEGSIEPLILAGEKGEGCAFSIVERQQFAHVYMPMQSYTKAFAPKEALMKGTLFPELWGAYPIPG